MNQPIARTHLRRNGLALVLALFSLMAFRPAPRARAAASVDMGVGLLGFGGTGGPVIGTQIGYEVVVFTVAPSDAASAVQASFTMPPQTTFVSAAQIEGPDAFTIAAPPVGATGIVTFTAPALPATANGFQLDVFQVIVFVPSATPSGTVLSASAAVSAAEFDPNLANNTSSSSGPATPCSSGCTHSFTASTTHHTTTVPTTVNVNGPDQTLTRVMALLNGTTVFDQTATGAPGSASELATETSARSALITAAGATAVISGPVQTGSAISPTTTSTTTSSDLGVTFTVTDLETIGPGTVLYGDDQSQTLFIPAGSVNEDTNTHLEHFFNAITTNTTSNVTTITLQFSATTACGAAVPGNVYCNPLGNNTPSALPGNHLAPLGGSNPNQTAGSSQPTTAAPNNLASNGNSSPGTPHQ